MNIRIATIPDLKSIVEIYNQAIDDEFCTADLEHVTISSMEEWFKQHTPDKYPIFIAEDKNNIVCGWCSLSPHRPGRKALASIAEISFYIHKNFRRKGIGKQLIAYALRKAPQLGFKNLFALLMDVNNASINILKTDGFIQWGHLPEIADFNGKICGQLIYGKRL
jgi:phosphinothricin acetyltransferase